MSTDVDPLDELFSDRGAQCSKAGGKFAPKVKPRPKKGTSIKLPSSQSVPNIKSTDSEIKKQSENHLDSVSEAHSLNNPSLVRNSSEHLAGQIMVDNVGLQTDLVSPDINGKTEGEEASGYTDVDPLDNILSGHIERSDRVGGEFPPKTNPHLQKDTFVKLASSESIKDKIVVENKTDNQAKIKLDSIPGVHSFDNSALFNTNSSEQHLIKEALVNNLNHHTDVVPPDVNAGEEVSKNNLDPLDEIFTDNVAKNARAGSKFLPKPKIRPKKGSSIKKPSSLSAQNTRVASNEIEKSSNSELDINPYLHVDVVIPDNNEKATQVNADTIVGLESFDDSFSFQATKSGVDVVSGPLDKVDSSLQPDASPVRVVSTIEGPAVGVSNASSLPTCPEDDITIDAFPQEESFIPDGGFHFTDGVLEVEEFETGPSTEGLGCTFDMTTQSGQRSLKLQPKPKFQADAKKNGTSISIPDESAAVPFSDYNELRSQVPPSEGLTGPSEASFPEASYSGDQPVELFESLEKSAELREKISIMVFDDSLEHQEASIAGQDDEPGISTRKLIKRTNKYSLVDEYDGDAPDDENLANDPNCSIEDGDGNDGENEVEEETQTEKKPRRSRKSSLQKEKPVRKRKKGNEAGDLVTQKPRKRFSHSTRRNRRQVDKVLLETPEDEIDTRKLRIRDIILLAEHRERITSKEGKTTETLPANQSAGTSFTGHNDNYFGDEDFASERGQFSNDQTTNSNYFNYHSYMKRTPRSRWSKQDTELFYEGVRQFGSDISMIQQLFPDRTRAQVKLKYKKEERQEPMRLHEALTNRSGDHSHFQRVIEHLKQLAGADDQNSVEDGSIDLTGNGEDVNPETNEVDNREEVDKREDDGMEPEVDKREDDEMEPDAYDSEDDSMWCQYKSDL